MLESHEVPFVDILLDGLDVFVKELFRPFYLLRLFVVPRVRDAIYQVAPHVDRALEMLATITREWYVRPPDCMIWDLTWLQLGNLLFVVS